MQESNVPIEWDERLKRIESNQALIMRALYQMDEGKLHHSNSVVLKDRVREIEKELS